MDEVTCSDKELQSVLQEIMGYCLCNNTKAEKAFFFIGNGSNGKSVFSKILQKLVGDENCSSTSLSELGKSFGLSQLVNSNVNIAAENNANAINSEIFKAVVSGDKVEVNRKYKEALTINLHTKLVMLFNELPESNDLTYGFFRKILIVPFNRTFTDSEKDVHLFDKLLDELSGIFHWALEGLKRLQKNDYVFSNCEACEKALEQYKNNLNPAALFFQQYFQIDDSSQVKRSDIYRIYLEYCQQNSYSPLQCQKFWRALKAYFADKGFNFRIKKIKGYEYLEGIRLKDYI